MTADPPVARDVARNVAFGAARGAAAVAGTVRLPHHARALRRRRLVTVAGEALLADLPRAVVLEEGDALVLADGRLVAVEAEPEPLLEARGASPGDLPRLAWHVGNRHAPCEMGDGWLRVPADRPMEALLRALGAEVSAVTAPFRPERGAYGEGGAAGQGSGHAHPHGAHDHVHAPGDDHGHGA